MNTDNYSLERPALVLPVAQPDARYECDICGTDDAVVPLYDIAEPDSNVIMQSGVQLFQKYTACQCMSCGEAYRINFCGGWLTPEYGVMKFTDDVDVHLPIEPTIDPAAKIEQVNG